MMNDKTTFHVFVEEHIVQEFQIEAANSKEAVQLAIKRYENGELVVDDGEVQYRQIAIVSPEDELSEWMPF